MIEIGKDEYLERKQHRENVYRSLNEFLERPSRETLKALCESLWAFNIYKDKDWLVDERILKDTTPEQVAQLIKDKVLNERLPLSERVDNVSIPGFGKSSLTELLFSRDPNKYPIYNKRAIEALSKLGFAVQPKIKYSEYIAIVEKLAKDLEYLRKVNSKTVGEEIPRYEFVDYVLNGVYEGKIPVHEVTRARFLKKRLDEATLNYAIGAIQGAVKQYFYWVERGVPEDKAVDRAINYALGVIAASGVLEDKEKREKFVFSLMAMSGLIKGLLEIIQNMYKSE